MKQIFLSNVLICSLSVNSCPEWSPATLCGGHYEIHFVESTYLLKENTEIVKIIPRKKKKNGITGQHFWLRQQTGHAGNRLSLVWSAGSRVSSWPIKWENFGLFKHSCHISLGRRGITGQFNSPGLLHNSFVQTYELTNDGGKKQ